MLSAFIFYRLMESSIEIFMKFVEKKGKSIKWLRDRRVHGKSSTFSVVTERL